MRAQTSAAMTAPGGDGPPASSACPGSGPDQAQSTEEFLCRFGDAIDDRVAEILDERDALRPRPRRRASFAVIALLLAVTATILLRHAPAAVCAVWLSTAVVCLAASTTGPGRA